MAPKKKQAAAAEEPQIEYIAPLDLKEHPKNPRKHPDYAIRKIAKSIEKFGFTQPIIISSDGFILAGHARRKAALMLGLKEVPCIRVPLTGQMAEAYILADNRLQTESEWDKSKLEMMLKDLDNVQYKMDATFLEEQELMSILKKKEPKKPKPEPVEKPYEEKEPEPKKEEPRAEHPPDVIRVIVCPKCGRDFKINTKNRGGK